MKLPFVNREAELRELEAAARRNRKETFCVAAYEEAERKECLKVKQLAPEQHELEDERWQIIRANISQG